jgi:DNA/RNA endonuclease G (NUC1)
MIRLMLIVIVMIYACSSLAADEIVSVFGDAFPVVKPGQVMVQRHLYLSCIDKDAHQPAWIAFRVKATDYGSDNHIERNFNTPQELRAICLEPGDFDKSGYELGHLYGLQFVTAKTEAHEVNQLCAIAAQRPALNRGPWLSVENRIKALSKQNTVTVLAGQLWLEHVEPMVNANEPHKVASHCWMHFTYGNTTEAYLIPQTVSRTDEIAKFEIEPAELRRKVSTEWIGSVK